MPTVVAPCAADGFGQVNINSEPGAAEVYVDEKFLGNTPATVKMTAGSHLVVLKAPGFADFSRTLDVPRASKLTLKAVLKTDSEK